MWILYSRGEDSAPHISWSIWGAITHCTFKSVLKTCVGVMVCGRVAFLLHHE